MIDAPQSRIVHVRVLVGDVGGLATCKRTVLKLDTLGTEAGTLVGTAVSGG